MSILQSLWSIVWPIAVAVAVHGSIPTGDAVGSDAVGGDAVGGTLLSLCYEDVVRGYLLL